MLKQLAICGILVGCTAGAAIAAPAQTVQPQIASPDSAGDVPVYEVNVVGRSITAVNFHVLGGNTPLELRGTALLPSAEGTARVQIERGATRIETEFRNVNPAQRFGPEYLTYVLWAISPDGRAKNLGEVQLSGTSAKMTVTTTLQDFGLIVTAEPYFAVSHPSDVVIMQSYVSPDTVGATAEVQAKYQLLQRGDYRLQVPESEVAALPQDPRVPLDLYEAQNAVRIARWAGADQHASAIYQRAVDQLHQAEGYEARRAGKAPIATVARQSVQTAEDARVLSLERQHQQQMAALKAENEARTEQAESSASLAQQRADQAEAARQAAQQQAAAASVAADTARRQAMITAQQAQQERARLQSQLNNVLQTRDTASGLIMNMPDVTFAVNRATLVPSAQIKLAKIAGILLSYPDLNVRVDGYTDNTGTPDYNQQLSEQRADSVRNFLISQGVKASSISATGLGETAPVASNASAQGRQQNRRVELVVNGAAIGSARPLDQP